MEEDKSSSIRSKVDHKCDDEPRKLSHQFIEQITKDFDEALIVGSGAFGTVYKGVCENGEEMAVKKLHSMSFDSKEFEREFENLRRLKHKNVVQLKGFCKESEEVLVEYQMRQVIAEKMHTALCFEFVRNGSLARHISDDGSSRLNWHIKFEIIKGICDGLEYLRHGLEFSVWHLDLKPDNILLDENMIPKIADFGLSRLLGDENTRRTINKNGTCGYMPPEYIEHGLVTKEFDIFSLGVIIAKLMAGHEGYSKIDEMTEHKFAKKVHDKWRKRLQETLAPRPLEVYCEQVKMCIQIALRCMKRNRQERPTIQSIVSHLRETDVLIGKLGLPREQFHEGESTLSEGGIQVGTPNYDSISAISPSPDNEEMAAESSRRKTNDSKMGTVRAERKKLPLQLLKKITNDFSEERIIGTFEYGIVYKGILEDGEIITVTRLEGDIQRWRKSTFLNEVQKITILKHENALQLVGFCRERHQIVVEHDGRYIITADPIVNLLCYEYLPKGSLQKNLFGVPSKMDWEIRFKIIKGICQGLLFQHRIDIPHLHLTPEDILLDNNMRPKIADYLRGFFIPQSTQWNASANIPWGYIAPENLYRGGFSTKSDIYSLGLVIMETSTGERNLATRKHGLCGLEFIKCVRDNWTEERIASEYPSLDALVLNQIKACINIGLECVQTDRHKRPSLETIVDMLKGLSQITSDGLLSLQTGRINFPFGPKRLSSSSVYLINNRDDRIAFRLETKFPRRYLTKLPFCGIVPPKCTYTLTVIAREQRKPPASSNDDCLTLQSSTAHREDLDNVDPASVGVFLDAAGDEVQEEKVEVACEPLADTISNDQVIDGPNYRKVLSVDVHPTEPWILTSNKRGHVCIWNYQTQAEMNSTEVTREPVYAAKFIEREGWFVVGSGDGCIYVYDYNTMEEVDMIEEAHDSHRIMSVAVNPTHSLLLSASDDHKIKLWDWTNGWHCIRTYEGHDDTVTQVMFNPRNSESFASASLDHTVKIWNIHSGTCNITWDGHPGGLLSVHYHPRYFQQSLICGSSDGDAKIWDLETDSCVDTLQGHEKGLSALCWHPELRALVTGSFDGTVRILSWMCHSNAYRLENIIGLNLGAVNALGYLKGLTRIVVGCDQGMALMEINVV